MAWNNIPNANQIEVDQLIRVVPPNADVSSSGAVVTPVRPGNTSAQPVDSTLATSPTSTSSASAGANDSAIALAWPARGALLNRFDDKANKGIDIGGKRGDAVVAADDGKVIHVGPLRGYGNLVIIKHNDTYLTAYGYNSRVLVEQGQEVSRGATIAFMGQGPERQPRLHFEIRRDGAPGVGGGDDHPLLPPRPAVGAGVGDLVRALDRARLPARHAAARRVQAAVNRATEGR